MRFIYGFLLLILLSRIANAEYRVFTLKISSQDGTQSREVLSTLDPDQYRGYHTVRPDETIVYTNTWRCRGRTSDHKEFCPDPKRVVADAEGEAPPPDAGGAPVSSSTPQTPTPPRSAESNP